MRRIILIFAAIALSLSAAEAQQDERYSQGVFTETTTVIRHKPDKPEKPKRERILYNARRGYQQEVTLDWWWMEGGPVENYSALRLSYIGGYRFGNYFFAGLGAGLNIGLTNSGKLKVYRDEWGWFNYIESDFDWGDGRITTSDSAPMSSVALPLFVYFKGYFTRTKVAPYISFAAGALFSLPVKIEVYDGSPIGDVENVIKYGGIEPLLEIAAGMSCHISDKVSLSFEVGCYIQKTYQFCDNLERFTLTDDDIEGSLLPGPMLSIGLTF